MIKKQIPAANHPALVAENFGWRHAGRKHAALTNITMCVESGEKVLLVGASGSGKSTFLHAVCGVLPQDSGYPDGTLRVAGAPPDPQAGKAGLVLQDPDSQVILARVGDDVAFGMENRGVPPDEIWPRARQALDTVGLPVPLEHPTSALSGGQKQRLALAGVLAMQPELICLDEPTANIDPDSVPGIRDAVLAACEATSATLLVVEHRVELWHEHVDRVLVFSGHTVIADGTPDIFHDPHYRSIFAEAGVRLPGAPLPQVRVGRRYRASSSSVEGVPTLSVSPGETHSDSETGDSAYSSASGSPTKLLSTENLVMARKDTARRSQLAEDMALYPAEVIALTGANGAGKTTAALALGGLLSPVSGQVRAEERLLRVSDPIPRRNSPHLWKSRHLVARIGSVFQEPEHQFLARTVSEELAFGPKRAGWPATRVSARVEELLERMRLSHVRRAQPHTLSGGEKRRLSVACMLAASPPVLILDEPTFGQDFTTFCALLYLVEEELCHGTSIVVISHDREFLEALGAKQIPVVPAEN